MCWGDLAENVSASCPKGTRVTVVGRLEQREYETKDGEKRDTVEVVADDVAPSLRWARVEVERITREKVAQGTSLVGAKGRAPDPVYGDENETF